MHTVCLLYAVSIMSTGDISSRLEPLFHCQKYALVLSLALVLNVKSLHDSTNPQNGTLLSLLYQCDMHTELLYYAEVTALWYYNMQNK